MRLNEGNKKNRKAKKPYIRNNRRHEDGTQKAYNGV